MVIKDTPQALKRVSVRWLPDPAYEDSDTVALNVGGYFLDLRVALADGSLQWSRAGERRTLKNDPLTFQWTRIIDSMGSNQPDEAAFQELPNGDDLETGTFNKDGVPTEYEEIWRDVTRKVYDSDCAWILQSTNGSEFLGKVGDIFLGMHRSEDGGFGVRKQVYDESTGDWKTTFEAGPVKSIPQMMQVIPVESQMKGNARTAGERVQVAGREYIIRGVVCQS